VSGPTAVTFGTPNAPSTTVSGLTAVGDYVLRLSANDGALTSTDDVVVHVVANQPPVVNAGADQTISAPQTSVTVAGTASDDGFPVPPGATTLSWSRVSGPTAVTFGTPNALSTTVSGLTAVGDYVLRLSANDGALTGTDDVIVHVVANQAPVVNAGLDQSITAPASTVNLTGGATDDGFPAPPGAVSASWTQLSGPAVVSFGDAHAFSTIASGFSVGGDYVLVLEASDGSLSSTDTLVVHVVTNQAPVVNAGADQTVSTPTSTVNVSGAVTDDGKPNPPAAVTVTWSRVSGPSTVTFGNPNALATTVSGLVAGDYQLRLSASDGDLTSMDELTVHVVANQPPVVGAGSDQTIAAPASSVNLSGTATDDGKPNPPGAMTFTWSRVSGPTTVTFGTPNALATTVSGLTGVGDYVLRLTANDGAVSASDDLVVHVTGGGQFTVDIPVAASSDDAEEKTTGGVNITSTDLDLTLDGTTAQSMIGMRFVNVPVPAGATVNSAYVQYKLNEKTSDPTNLVIQGQAIDNAPTFTTAKNNITNRARTTAGVPWAPPPWTTATHSAGPEQRTPDLGPVLQEIVVRPGWTSGNALALLVSGDGRRVADAFDQAGATPVLHIVYTTGGPPPNQPPLVNAGPDQSVTMPASASLNATATDDGLPNGTLTRQWSQVSGPGTATFVDPSAAATTASFDQAGTYVLRLSASDGVLGGSDDVTVTVLGPGSLVTVDIPLVAGSDDAEQLASGSVNITSSDLDMVIDGTTVQSAVGLRFANVNVPRNATIASASVQFRSDEVSSDATTLLLQGQAIDNAPTFATTKNSITTRARTAASTTWTPAAWTQTSLSGPAQRTADLAGIVSEIVHRPGWNPGNALALVITGSGKRVADSFEGSAAPVLRITYQL
ncbi:MAG TPA: hypothetical protein VFZ17_13755, partial [Acidimicrobiia bacterium]|nr:hypothetical protein [Acidimicrobiia bacterium]